MRKDLEQTYLERAVIEAEIAKSMAERKVLELKLEQYMQEHTFRLATGNSVGDRIAKREYPWDERD